MQTKTEHWVKPNLQESGVGKVRWLACLGDGATRGHIGCLKKTFMDSSLKTNGILK